MDITEGLNFLLSLYQCSCSCINIYIYIFYEVCLVTTVDRTEITDLGILISYLSKDKSKFYKFKQRNTKANQDFTVTVIMTNYNYSLFCLSRSYIRA